VGKNYGNKKCKGDMKTPEGVFEVKQIQPATTWGHDFKDGKGVIEHAYGDWFIRLDAPPHDGIGIHGTHAPESIGTRATEGCIRLNNENLNKLKPLVRIGMKVTIETSQKDMEADGNEYAPTPSPKQDIVPAQEAQKPVAEVSKTTAENTATEQKPAVEEPQTEYAPGEIIEHTIESGQYISHVAVKYHTTTAKILELNEGLDPAKIRPGQKIKVQPNTDGKSTKPAVVEDPNGTYHTIVSGDMLGKLANTYGTTVEKIKELNPDINPNNLKLGSKIRIK
jgi:LysM repeat protein